MRVLCVNLNYIGDALFTTAALGLLKGRLPEARIDVLAGKRAAAVLEGNPAINELFIRPPHGGLGRALALDRKLRSGNYDAVVLFQSTLANAFLAWRARVPVRVGFAREGCAPMLTHVVPSRFPGEHDVDAYLRVANAVVRRDGTASPVDPRTFCLSMALSPDDVAFASNFLDSHEVIPPVVGLVIGTTRQQKRWPEQHFARLADKLWSVAGVSCVLLGGPEEVEVAQRILSLTHSAPIVSAIGKTTEKQLAALIARLRVVVSADSGPLHIATAMATPVVALFGSTDPADTGPWHPSDRADDASSPEMAVLYDALSCAPCRKTPTCDGRFDCMRLLTPERVFDAVTELTHLTVAGRQRLPVVGSEFLTPRPPSLPLVPRSREGGEATAIRQVMPLIESSPPPSLEGGTTGTEGGRGDREPRDRTRRPRTLGGRPVRSILILTKHRFMGDTIVAVPLLRATREIFPDARILLLTGKDAATALRNCPYDVTLLPNDPKTQARTPAASVRLSVSLLQRMGWLRLHDRPDLCLVADRSLRAAAAARLCGGRVRAGFDTEGRGWLLTRPIPYSGNRPETECCLDILRAVAPELPEEPPYDPHPLLWPSSEECARGAQILAQHGIGDARSPRRLLVGMQPGASQGDRKQWSPERFAAVGRALIAHGATLVLLGHGEAEEEAARQMHAALESQGTIGAGAVVDLTSKTTLRETIGVLTHLALFVGNDTGVSHIAASVGIATVTLFGPTCSQKWGSFGPCSVVIASPDGCMDSIPVATVERAALDLLAAAAVAP